MDYIELVDLQNSLTPGVADTFNEQDMQRAITAASRGVDAICRRRFSLDDGPVDRLYTVHGDTVGIDDVPRIDDEDAAITVTFDGTEWVEGTDYLLEPLNAAADGRPYTQIRILTTAFDSTPGALNVNAVFGWQTVPEPVAAATAILAGKLLLRMRQAPLGFQMTEVNAIRLGTGDPDVSWLLTDLLKARLLKSLQLG